MGIATQVALLTPVLIGFAGLAVDVGWMQSSRTHLQDVTDAAALAGATRIGNAQEVRALARSIASANQVAGRAVNLTDADIEVGTWNGATFTPDGAGEFVKVTARHSNLPLFLGGVFGVGTTDLGAVAVARTGGVARTGWPCIMFADQAFEFNGSAVITGYDSTTGAVTQPGVCGNMNNIRLQGNYNMLADVHAGPGGTVSVTGSATMLGDVTPMPQRFVLPRVAMPTTGRTFSQQSQANQVVTLTGGAPYRMPNGFSVDGNARIQVNSGPVEIFASGTVTLNGGGFLNTTRDPSQLIIHVVGAGSVHINGNSDFYGIIDAPDSEVELNGNADFYGATTGRIIHHNGNNDVFLDTSLVDDTGTEVPAPSGHARLVW